MLGFRFLEQDEEVTFELENSHRGVQAINVKPKQERPPRRPQRTFKPKFQGFNENRPSRNNYQNFDDSSQTENNR